MNGSKPIPFPGNNNIPLVGQPFTFKSWFPTALVVCNCDAKEPVQIVGSGVHQCPACHRGFMIGALQYNAQTGQLNVNIAVVMAQQPEPIPS